MFDDLKVLAKCAKDIPACVIGQMPEWAWQSLWLLAGIFIILIVVNASVIIKTIAGTYGVLVAYAAVLIPFIVSYINHNGWI